MQVIDLHPKLGCKGWFYTVLTVVAGALTAVVFPVYVAQGGNVSSGSSILGRFA